MKKPKSEKFWLDETGSMEKARKIREREERYSKLIHYLKEHRGNNICELGKDCLGLKIFGIYQTIQNYHHIKKRSKGREDEPRNLIGVCLYCHNQAHNLYPKHPPFKEEYLLNLVKELNEKYNIPEEWE